MGNRNQKTLLISAFIIVGLTVVGIFALNYVVKKISLMEPPPLAIAEPRKPEFPLGADDQLKPKMPFEMPPMGNGGLQDDSAPQRMRPPPRRMPPPKMPPQNGNGAMRRLRNGKEAPDIERRPPQPPPRAQPGTDDRAPSPQDPRGTPGYYYPPPFPPNLSPEERQRIEDELQRRREMFDQGQFPPGYYPPPPPPGYQDQYYPPEMDQEPDEYEPDYDYESDYGWDEDLEGKRDGNADDTESVAKAFDDLANDLDDLPDTDLIVEDEYINEFYE